MITVGLTIDNNRKTRIQVTTSKKIKLKINSLREEKI